MQVMYPLRSNAPTRLRLHTLLAGMALLCTTTASVAAVKVLPAGQVSIVRDGNGSRWRCETGTSMRAICVRHPAAPAPRADKAANAGVRR